MYGVKCEQGNFLMLVCTVGMAYTLYFILKSVIYLNERLYSFTLYLHSYCYCYYYSATATAIPSSVKVETLPFTSSILSNNGQHHNPSKWHKMFLCVSGVT